FPVCRAPTMTTTGEEVNALEMNLER
ncbi:MAG: hypothetical protein H6Q32_1112, partial [Bacteroidetes bacterium]|nr:hypothetical protein [Bacteroidota bacterium]